MTLQFDVSVTGSQVGRALAEDAEETWYALLELADAGSSFSEEVADYAVSSDADKVVAFLRSLAEKIEASN